MSDDEDGNVASPKHSGFGELVQQYKDHLQDLRRGMPSGISESFGHARELLPESELDEYEGFQPGDSVIPPGGDLEAYKQALEELIAEFESDVEEFPTEDGPEVVGVSFHNGRKHLLLADGSTILSPSEETEDHLPHADDFEYSPESEANNVMYNSQQEPELPDESNDFGSSDMYSMQDTVARTDEFAEEDSDDISQQLVNVLQKVEGKTSSRIDQNQPDEATNAVWDKPDLSIKNKRGKPLWDVYFDDDGVDKIRFYNHTVLVKESPGDEYTMRNATDHVVERVKSVAVDQATGNIYYLSMDGQHVTTWLNNGCRIDHYRTADGADKYYLLDAAGKNQAEIVNVSFDMENDAVSYETVDGDEMVTMRSRRLNSTG